MDISESIEEKYFNDARDTVAKLITKVTTTTTTADCLNRELLLMDAGHRYADLQKYPRDFAGTTFNQLVDILKNKDTHLIMYDASQIICSISFLYNY